MNVSFSNRLSSVVTLTCITFATFGGAITARAGHHVPGRFAPYQNCRLCHGNDLQGGIGRSCYKCHGRQWPGGETPPVADAAGPYAGAAGADLVLDGSRSIDVDGVIASYLWDFGDGAVGTGPNPRHAYASSGTYSIFLTVTDDNGLTDTASTVADIEAAANMSPVAVAGGPYTGSTGVAVQFDGSASLDMDGTIVSYEWDYGDGGTGSGANPSYAYASDGVFTVQLIVTDDAGATNATQTLVSISASSNAPPVVDLGGPYSGAVGEEIQIDASNTSDPDGDPLFFLWNYGDGSQPPLPSQSPLTSHSFSAPGSYLVQCAVSDGAHVPVTAEVLVEVSDEDPAPPVPVLGDSWAVRVPLQQAEFVVSFQAMYGFLWVQSTYSDGSVGLGVGFELDGMVVWMDTSGVIFVGNVDYAAGTMMGIVIDNSAGSSVWFAEEL